MMNGCTKLITALRGAGGEWYKGGKEYIYGYISGVFGGRLIGESDLF